jgi:DNA modification methylase
VSAVVLRGDAAHLPLPDGSVDLICTSPPYFGQRDYRDGGESLAGQIGSEETPAEYIAALLRCTQEWIRVLKPSGSLFVNLGDKFSQRTQVRRSSHQPGIHVGKFEEFGESWAERAAKGATRMPWQNVISDDGDWVQEKSLMQLPQRYSIGCTDQLGLILRRDIIWHKTSGMPESVTDRCHTSHEYLFHFTREPRYFSAGDEIRQPLAAPERKAGLSAFRARDTSIERASTGAYDGQNPLGAMPGSVWRMAPSSLVVPAWLGVDHYAPYPPELCRRIILGWSPSGICTECGEGRFPIGVKGATGRTEDPSSWSETIAYFPAEGRAPISKTAFRRGVTSTITGYACACPRATAPTRPALVADPFGGTGTTALTASVLGRNAVTVDLGADYCRIAQWRINDPAERARALGVPKPPPVPEGQASLFDQIGGAS